jgi:hypothetical protein
MFARGAAPHMLLTLVVALALTGVGVDPTPQSEQYRDRVAAAAKESLVSYERWLGPLPLESVNVNAPDLPSRAPQPFMEIEAHVAYAIALQYWSAAGDTETPIARGLSWYLQSRVVERLFNLQYGALAHSADGRRFFGGHVPWPLPSLRLSRWTAGVAGHEAHRAPRGVNAETMRAALAFASLERYLGWPVLQGGLRALAVDRTQPLSIERVETTVGDAAAQDLRWFFSAAFDPGISFDYAVDELTTMPRACGTASCYQTMVNVSRRGPGQFTGSTRQPIGSYESGQGVALRVTFADGQEVTSSWDGRAAKRTFTYESAAPAVAAELDPQGAMLLDVTPLDHVRSTSPRTNLPIAKWVARWMVWLQDAMLAGSALL